MNTLRSYKRSKLALYKELREQGYDYYHCGDCHEEFKEANRVDEGVEDE